MELLYDKKIFALDADEEAAAGIISDYISGNLDEHEVRSQLNDLIKAIKNTWEPK